MIFSIENHIIQLSVSFLLFIRFSMNIWQAIRLAVENGKLKTENAFILRSFIFGYAQRALVGPSGLEPPTSCLSGTRSNLLSYDPSWLA